MTAGKSLLRWAGIVLVGVALVVGLAVAALPLWLRTSHGHRTVERVLTSLLNERVPGSVSVGRLSGDVLRGLRVEDVTVRNPRGELLGHADWLAARWRPVALLRRREVDRVTAAHPMVMLERGTWRQLPGPRSRAAILWEIDARDGEVRYAATRFAQVTGTATLRTGTALDVRALTALVAGVALDASGKVDWSGARPWVATRFRVERRGVLDGNGSLFYTPGRLEGEIDRLTMAAPVMDKLVGGGGPLAVRADIAGAPDRLRVVARAAQGERTLRLLALVDGVARSAVVDADLGGVPRPIRLHGRVRYSGGALEVPALHAAIGGSRLDGSGRLRDRTVRASMDFRVSPTEARLIALQPLAPVRAHLEVDGPPRDLDVRARATLPGSRVSVRARCDLPARRARGEAIAYEIRLAQLLSRAPPVTVSTALAFDVRWAPPAMVAKVSIDRGQVRYLGRSFEGIAGAGWIRPGSNGEAVIEGLSGRFVGQRGQPRVALRGHLRWTRQRIALAETSVALGESRVAGEAEYARDRARLAVRVAEMTLSPGLVAALLRYRPPLPWAGQAALDGAADDFTVRVALTTEIGPGTLTGRVRRAEGALELSAIDLRLGDSFLRGAARLARGRLTASLRELVLQPALIHRCAPALDPEWPIRVRGTADGTRDGIDVALAADAGPSATEVRGRISVAARRFQLAGTVDTLDRAVLKPNPKRVRGSLQFAAQGALAGGGVVGTATIRNLRGYAMDSPFYRGAVDVRLEGRAFEITNARLVTPPARIVARGGGDLRGTFHLRYGAVVTDVWALRRVPRELRLLIGLNGILTGNTVEGAIDKRPGQKVTLTYRVLPIGAAQLQFLFRVLTGRAPVFSAWPQPPERR